MYSWKFKVVTDFKVLPYEVHGHTAWLNWMLGLGGDNSRSNISLLADDIELVLQASQKRCGPFGESWTSKYLLEGTTKATIV